MIALSFVVDQFIKRCLIDISSDRPGSPGKSERGSPQTASSANESLRTDIKSVRVKYSSMPNPVSTFAVVLPCFGDHETHTRYGVGAGDEAHA
jgi:hypothetical protein